MATLINIRPTKSSASSEQMDSTAKDLGMSRNEMILTAIDILRGFDIIFFKKLRKYSAAHKVSISTAIQNTIIKLWAEDAAKSKAWDIDHRIFDEFMQVGNQVIDPQSLYKLIFDKTYDNETKKRFFELKAMIDSKKELSEEDIEFYNDFKPIYLYSPKIKQKVQEENSDFWSQSS